MGMRPLGLSVTIYGSLLALGASATGCTGTEDFEVNAVESASVVANHHGSKTPIQATVFQAAGPNAASIQSTVDQFRVALGGANNGNVPGPLLTGRREINWDGGGSTATALGPTPFDVFLNNRGNRTITPGTGFVQATPTGLAETFGNPTYATIFEPFSLPRLFSPIGSNRTDAVFFVPGTAGATAAATRGFGLILADVDLPNGTTNHKPSSKVEYFDADGKLLFRSFVPASPGDGGLTFFGIVLDDARIARVRITAGNSELGPNDTRRRDIVVMDDFIYGEPQPQPHGCDEPDAVGDGSEDTN